MSTDPFPTIRHLDNYVQQELTRLTQLDQAVKSVMRHLEDQAELERRLALLKTQEQEALGRCEELKTRQKTVAYELARNRKGLQDTFQTELQQRDKARQQWTEEEVVYQEGLRLRRIELDQVQVAILAKRDELADLERRLTATVEAVLGGKARS